MKGDRVYTNTTPASENKLITLKNIAKGNYIIRAVCNKEIRQSKILKL